MNIINSIKKGWNKLMTNKKKDTYIWYSPATDITGQKLAEALGVSHGSTLPKDKKLVIGWGAKTKKAAIIPGKVTVLNHPDNIRTNRNKLESMAVMRDAGVNIAPFIDADHIKGIKKGGKVTDVVLPVVGRTKFHQGGKGFWNCPTMTHVIAAVNAGAQYFQNLIEVESEFRLHMFDGQVIYAVKKVKRSVEEMEAAYIKHETDRQTELAKKNNNVLDLDTMKLFLTRQAKKFAQDGANMLIRSNRLGWKFAKVKKVDAKLVEEAKKALAALNLQFGAVDGCIDVDGKAWIFEVNTGPGLEASPFDSYVESFSKKIEEILNGGPEKKEVPKPKMATTAKKVTGKVGTKEELQTKLRLASEMVDVADPDDVAVLDKVFKKMFG